MGKRPRTALTLALFLFVATVGPAAAEDSSALPERKSFGEAFKTFAADGRYLVTFPARTTAKGVWLTTAVVGATALVMNRDEENREEVLESDGETAGRIARVFEPLGRYEVEAAALGTFYLVGRGMKSERMVSTAATAFEAYLWTGIFTSVSKWAFGRERPGRGSGEGEFFAGDTIFPSGHTARSFAIAAVFADRYGRPGAYVAYPVAALIGLSTVQEDLHWASDIVAGAGLGLAIGKGIAARHRAPVSEGTAGPNTGPAGATGARWEVLPGPGGATLRIEF